MKIKLNPGFRLFLIKTAVFLGVFIIFSLIIGQKIVASKLLYKFGIHIYGGMGYVLLFSIVGFILVYRERLLKIESFGYKKTNLIFLVLSILFLTGFYILELNIDKVKISVMNIIFVHALFLAVFGFLLLGIYGLNLVKKFFIDFKRELSYFLIFGIIVYSLMRYVWELWPYFSFFVLKAVSFIFSILTPDYKIIAPATIVVKNFSATIGEACSGVFSIFIFTALYLFIVLLDWNKINKKKAVFLFLPAILGAFLLNVLRVFVLFVVGAYVSQELALGMYHSYTGMVFFLIYFAIFWILFYKWMRDEPGLYKKFIQDSLYRNSIFLMLGTFIMAVLGFVFWMISARLFSSEQVGLVTTIISAAGLITSFSLLGLNSGIIRFLPKSERKNKKINTAFTLVALITIVITSIFLLFAGKISPELIFIKKNIIFSFIFIIFMIFNSLNSMIDSVFIAYRSSEFVLLKNFIFSFSKIILPFFLVSFGAYGLFGSWMIAVILAFIAVFFILIIKFDYSPRFVFYDSIIRKIGKYSFGNYAAGFIGGLPVLVLPLIIISKLGADFSAYFYMAMMIANLLFIIPNATSNSLFAEGSYDEDKIREQLRKAVKIIAVLMIPAILAIIFFGKYVLFFFGQEYSIEGFRFLQLLALSGIFVAINAVLGTLFRVEKRVKELIIISIIGAGLVLGLSLLFLNMGLGLSGVGWAWVINQFIVCIVYLGLWGLSK